MSTTPEPVHSKPRDEQDDALSHIFGFDPSIYLCGKKVRSQTYLRFAHHSQVENACIVCVALWEAMPLHKQWELHMMHMRHLGA